PILTIHYDFQAQHKITLSIPNCFIKQHLSPRNIVHHPELWYHLEKELERLEDVTMGNTKHTGPMKISKKPRPDLWVSKIPFGLGKIKPHHIRDTMKVTWENRDNLPYATRILTQGVCDGCALGVAGLKDQTLTGPHLCT